MISLSNIIKSVAVVDDRYRENLQFVMTAHEADGTPVIKRRTLGATASFSELPRIMPEKDGYLEQLNRIKVEVAEEQKELRSLTRQLEDMRAEVVKLEEKRASLEKLKGLDIGEQAAKIIQDAQEQAEQILAVARENAASAVEDMRGQGYREGLEQGTREAKEQVRAENEQGIRTISALLEELSSLQAAIVKENESEIVNMIIAVAEKVIGRQLREDPVTVVDMLRGVVEQNKREEFIKVVISKDLLPVEAKVSEGIKRMITDLGQQIDVLVESDGQPAGLVVETPGGFTDLSVGSQLENIAETLHET